jgi:hypothetical protein
VRNPPRLWPAVNTPEREAEAIKDLDGNLHGVVYNVNAWGASLALYEFSARQGTSAPKELAWHWVWIACHECVMQTYYLRERITTIRGHKVKDCPSLAPFIDSKKLREASKLLNDSFPDIEELRHAVAHQGSVSTNPSKHAHDGFGLVGFREPDVFSAPYNGKLRSLRMTRDRFLVLEQVASTFFAAFDSAAQELERLGHAVD